jgi:HJR/Mrr/RecB family endonuclease
MEVLSTLILILLLAVVVCLVFAWARRALRAKRGSIAAPAERQPALQERHVGVIQQFLRDMRADDHRFYVDNTVRDCISEIARREGRSDVVPNYGEWLSQWQTRGNLPQEYLQLASYLKQTFGEQHNLLLQKKRQDEERVEREKEAAGEAECERLLAENKDLVDKFLEITERKVSVLDDYGDENWDALPKEVDTCLRKIAQREGLEENWLLSQKEKKKSAFPARLYVPERYVRMEKKLYGLFREYHENRKGSTVSRPEVGELSGAEFEAYVGRILKESGYEDVRGTPTTGDQGADLIAKKGERTIAIQVKRYQGPVGNKAVQEVAAAVKFYGAHEGWVITNATFTQSAKALAQKNNIRLIDGIELESMRNQL